MASTSSVVAHPPTHSQTLPVNYRCLSAKYERSSKPWAFSAHVQDSAVSKQFSQIINRISGDRVFRPVALTLLLAQ